MEGLTFDTGALISLMRRRQRIWQIFNLATQRGIRMTIPVIVLAEWWRERSAFAETILKACDVEPMYPAIAKAAGEALAAVADAGAADAIVMASAAKRGDVVYTSDVDDLTRLRRYFPGVRVLAA